MPKSKQQIPGRVRSAYEFIKAHRHQYSVRGDSGGSNAGKMMARQPRRSLIFLVAVLSACKQDGIAARISAVARSGPGHYIVLSEMAPFGWGRVCLFGPYTSAEEIVQITGVSGAARATHGIESNDGIDHLLLFVEGDRIVREVELRRANADFAPELVRKCYSRGEAVFAVRVAPANSFGNIGPR